MARMTDERLAEIRKIVDDNDNEWWKIDGERLAIAEELLSEIDALREENRKLKGESNA